MKFPKRILTNEIVEWYDSQALPVVRLEEVGRQHGVLPPQVHEAMVEVYHQYLADPEAYKPTQTAWMVWERAKKVQGRHYQIASEVIKKLQADNKRLRNREATIIYGWGLGSIIFFMAFAWVILQ